MMATGPFAEPTFRRLVDSEHEVLALVTRPLPAHRGRRSTPPQPLRELAAERQLEVLDPVDINAPEACRELARRRADLHVVCDYGQILSPEALGTARLGGINLHGSLLPRYRGAAPVNWALWNGDAETGVTVIHMTPRLDAGPCLVRQATPIGEEEDAEELEARLAALGVEAVCSAIEMLSHWDGRAPLGEIQDPRQATRAPRLRKQHGRIDWTRSAHQIRNQVRALKPWPGTFTLLPRPGREPLRLIVDRVAVAEGSSDAPPGSIVRATGEALHVATGCGILAIERLQPAGKRLMQVDEFLCGHPLEPGAQFDKPA